MIKKFFAAAQVKIFFATRSSENESIIFFSLKLNEFKEIYIFIYDLQLQLFLW